MHKICLAPVLSATLSRDSCWIICPCLLLRLLDDLHHAPALGSAERASFHQEHTVADSTGVGFVVCLEPGGPTQHLAVERVLDAVLDRDHDGLVHLVADDQALADLARRAVLDDSLSYGVLAHAFSLVPGAVRMPSSRSRTTV